MVMVMMVNSVPPFQFFTVSMRVDQHQDEYDQTDKAEDDHARTVDP
jgi:hypothetical protein